MHTTFSNLIKSISAVFKPEAAFVAQSPGISNDAGSKGAKNAVGALGTHSKNRMFAPKEKSHDFRTKQTTEYHEKQLVNATVTSVRDFGVFIEMPNGESGLVPNHEVCWPDQKRTYAKGQKVDVVVKGFRVGVGLNLSIRWARMHDALSKYVNENPVKSVVKGHVKRVVDYGIFVTLANGVSALMHNSAIPDGVCFSRENIGDEITVEILSIDKELQRISLKYMDSQ